MTESGVVIEDAANPVHLWPTMLPPNKLSPTHRSLHLKPP